MNTPVGAAFFDVAAPDPLNDPIDQEARLAFQGGKTGLPESVKTKSPAFERLDTGSERAEFVDAGFGWCPYSEFQSMVFKLISTSKLLHNCTPPFRASVKHGCMNMGYIGAHAYCRRGLLRRGGT